MRRARPAGSDKFSLSPNIVKPPEHGHPHTATMSTATASRTPKRLKVTSSPSTDVEINIDTPLAKYFARFSPNVLDAEIVSNDLRVGRCTWWDRCNPKLFGAKIKCSELSIGKGNLRISFMRTVRIPNRVDAQPGNLPQGMDEFPLYNVADFPNLPRRMREKGGALMPIYRMSSYAAEITSNASL